MMIDRLLEKMELDSDCWVWVGGQSEGYGAISYNGKSVGVHRIAYTIFIGEIPRGLEIDHLCMKKLCFNPDHLEAVTHKENIIRAEKAYRKKHCKRGHKLDGNSYLSIHPLNKSIMRACKDCVSLRSKERYKRLKGE